MKYVGNAFSLGMCAGCREMDLYVERLSLEEVKKEDFEGAESIFGHESTVNVFNKLFGTDFKVNRVSVNLGEGDEVYVFQVLERLPEGKILSDDELKRLVEEGKVSLYKVRVEKAEGCE